MNKNNNKINENFSWTIDSLFKKLKERFNFFKKNVDDIEKDSLVYTEILNSISWYISFSFTEENIDRISGIKDFINNLYIKLFQYTLKWEYLKSDVKVLILALNDFADRFNNSNIENKNNKEFIKFFDDIKSLKYDLKMLDDLCNFIKFKRRYIITPYWEETQDWKNDSIERKLYHYLWNINFIAHSIDEDYNKDIITILVSLYQKIIKLENTKYWDYIKIIKDILVLNLFKISLVSWKNKFDYYENGNIDTLFIENEIRKTSFWKYEKILRFIKWHKSNNINSTIESYKKDLFNDGKITTLWIFLLLKYYKDIDKSKDNLKEIYSIYRKYVFIDNKNEQNKEIKILLYLNCLFIWNNLLSFLIEEYKNTWKEDLISEIDNFFKELLNISNSIDDQNYKNYFTHYKYWYFKNAEYFRKSNNKEVSFKYLNWIAQTAYDSIKKSLKIFNSISCHNYYEFESDDFFIKVDWFDYKIYCHNLFIFPFVIEDNKENIIHELDISKENLLDVKYIEKFWRIQTDLENNKLEAMTIIWIFTWIVVYSIWTIQIFSIIEDIWSAILFSGIFLSWMLFLIWGIFFKSHFSIENDLKYNKWLQLFLIALFILLLSISWKYYFSENNWVLNWNRWEQIYDKLDSKITEAKEIKEYIDLKIERYEELNTNLNNSIEKYNNINR